MSNSKEVLSEFIEITSATEDVANFYLESSNWSLQDAIANYLANSSESGDRPDEMPDNNEADAMFMPSTNSSRTGTGTSMETDEMTAKSKKKTGSSRTTRPKIATLHNMSQNSDSDEEGQAFYAGGSERSGQQVLGPPKRKNFSEKLTEMFRQAHEQIQDLPSTSSGPVWGSGLRLGQTENDHSVVNADKGNSRKTNSVILKLWSQGFSINDGALRSYDDPENKEFLETVMRGEIPSELIEMGNMVSVDVEDHRQEEYKWVAKDLKTFKGTGQTLGSPAPTVVSAENPPPKITPPENNANNEQQAAERINVNKNEEVTQLQIRLADGTRLLSQFNLTHTVADIRTFIQIARPHYSEREFTLVSSFPTRELNDGTETIEKAGLKNAAIMQRLK